MRNRGAALPTILALVAAVLVAGLAMGSLSTLSLQFNRRQMDTTRSEMAARSALAYFLARVQSHEASIDSDVSPLDPKPFDINDIFPDGLRVEEDGYAASLHFDPDVAYYSSDNLGGEEPKLGSLDRDDIPRIPPFALDLVVTVDGPQRVQRYRAILQRSWPFAVYAKHGSIVFMGQVELDPTEPDFGSTKIPSLIEGDVYTEWVSRSDYGTLVNGYGLGAFTDPAKVLANIEARAGYHPSRLPYHPLILGMEGIINPTKTPKDVEYDVPGDDRTEMLYSYHSSDWPRAWGESETVTPEQPVFRGSDSGTAVFVDSGNIHDGDFYYDHSLDVEIGPAVVTATPENEFQGEVHLRRAPLRDPLASLEIPDSAGFVALNFSSPDDTLLTYASNLVTSGGMPVPPDDFEWNDDGGVEPKLMTETLRLTESENSLGGPVSPHYLIQGSVSNRQSIYHPDEEKLFVREMFAGLELEGVTLLVNGDLDLGAEALEKALPIYGTGATLIVNGQLTIGNARIDSGDQGFVIFAKDIVLKAGGVFKGLLIAENSITVLPKYEDPSGTTPALGALEIDGGIMCQGEGGITLRGATVKHDTRYLKGVNGAGEFFLASWKKI